MRENNNLDQINAGADGQDEGKETLLSEEKNSAAGAEKDYLDWLDEEIPVQSENSGQGRENNKKNAGRGGKKKNRENSRIRDGVRYNKKGEVAIFQPFTVKDIVFLAIIGAAALITSAVMPLVAQVPIFGLPQLVTGLQMSVFPTIGLMKVRKTGSVFIVSLLVSVLELFMAPAMGVTSLISAIIIEAINILTFKGYRKDIACFVSGMLINPMTLPFYYLYCMAFETDSIFFKAAGDSPWVAVGISAAVIAVCALGAGLGILISREIRKAGLMKK